LKQAQKANAYIPEKMVIIK